MRPKLFTLAVATVFLFAACSSSSSSPSPSGGASSPAASGPAGSAAPSGERGGGRLGSRLDHRDRHPVRLAVVARGGRGADPDAARLPRRRIPTSRSTTSRSPATTATVMVDQVQQRRRPRPVLRQRRVRAGVDRPGLPGAARRLHRQVGLRHEPVLRRATRRSSRARTARPTACPRTATRSRWPTTRDLVPTPPTTMDELVTTGRGAQGQERPQGADVPEPGPRPRPRVPLCPGRRAPDRRRHGLGDRHRRVQGGRPVVPGPVQERPRHDRQRPRRRLVRRGARQEAGRHHLRRRLARPGHDQRPTRTSSTPGPRCRPARPAAR